ncbi:hypothetical protein WA538_003568 [Blastocystis sp. DL]
MTVRSIIDSILSGVAYVVIAYTIYCVYQTFASTTTIPFPESNSNISIFWSAPFLSGGGYCSEAMSLVKALDKRGFDVHIQQHGDSVNQGFINGVDPQDQAVLWRLINKRKRSHGDIVIEVCHSEPGAWKPASFSTSPCPLFSSRHSYHIGRTMFETDRLPEGWLKKLDSMDEVWVPSTFMKTIFEEGGATNVHVIGESVDTVFFRPIESLRLHATLSPSTDTANSFHVSRKTLIADTFELHPKFAEKNNVFLSIFKWEMRKGWDILLDVFFHTFSINDPVSLIIITQEYHETQSITDQVNQFILQSFSASQRTLLPHYFILTQYVPETYLPYIYNLATAVVLPTRGEGWGRVAQEAMSCGVPVITTGYGGALTFIHEANAFLVPIQGFSEIKEGAFSGHRLVEPNRTEVARCMKEVLDHPEKAKQKGKRARQDMVNEYSEEAFGAILEREFRRIGRVMWQKQQADNSEL